MAQHSKLYVPKKEEEYLALFGPVMGYKKMTPTFLKKMNELMNPDLEDWSDFLVGKVKQELKFTKEIEQLWLTEFSQFIALPDGIEKEWEEDYKDHHPANGHIQFAHGTPSGYSQTNFMVKPQVGDFYIFPAELFHCVYPFKTKGERRSFSVNFSFIEVPKQTVDKQ